MFTSTWALTRPQLSSSKTPRRVEVSEFKDSTLVSIREFYQKDDEYLPGKKVLSNPILCAVDSHSARAFPCPSINTKP
jgi:Transcriptional Coactivator p15 (PC4)